MQRSEDGLVVVLGVAGSGKTSVALGRTKVLCDQIPEEGEERFFRTESAVGFVLSARLCTYLERTCKQLSLYDMPVREYHHLRGQLMELRRLDDSGFEREVTGERGELEGTIVWLHAADVSVARHLSNELRVAVASPPPERESVRRTVARRTGEQEEALAELWTGLVKGVAGVADSLLNGRSGSHFRLEGLAARLDEVRARFARELEASPAWTGAAHRELRQNVRSAVRERIVRALRLPEAYAVVIAEGALRDQLLSAKGRVEEQEARTAIERASTRIKARRLSDPDLDVLLSLAHVMSLGYRGREDRDPISHLTEPQWYTQVFIDEFQDFTEVQLFLMGAQAHPDRRTVTVVGDYHQKLTQGRRIDLAAAFPWATPEETRPGVLLENKRQTGALARLSQRFREEVLGDSPEVALTFSSGEERPRFVDAGDEELEDAVYEEIVRIPKHKSVAVVCPNEGLAQKLEEALRYRLGATYRETRLSSRADLLARFYVHFTTALEAKGLEFDATVVPALDGYQLGDPAQANACYVALSRPRTGLSLIGALPQLESRWQRFMHEGLVEEVTL